MLGAQRSPYLEPGEWQIFVGYRHLRSDRHFRGTEEQEERHRLRNFVVNKQQLLDLSGTYAINERLNVTLSIPYLVYGSWSIPLPINPPGERQVQSAEGLGDITLTGRYWLLEPRRHRDGNVLLGLGVKFPTGNPDARDRFPDITGGNPQVKAVDSSIQPGDGGWGVVLDFQAFQRVGSGQVFANATYLINPRNTNDTLSIRSILRGPENTPRHLRFNSVPDQYLARVGAAAPVPGAKGLSVSLAARIEGIPPEDLFGGSDGWRRPGYVIFVEPGLIYTEGDSTWAISVPVRTHQNRQPNSRGEEGDATVADYFFLLSYSRRFGR